MAFRAKAKKLNADQLWDYALKALGQRAYSAGEIRQKLMGRAETSADVTQTMLKLRDYGLTDDKKFSEAFASSRLQNQGLGSFRVLRQLRAKRVAGPVAANAVSTAYAGTSEAALIENFLSRKYRNTDLREFLKQQKNVASVYRRLRTAGFSSGSSLDALKRYTKSVEDWSEPPEEDADLS
ncbi:MAG: recombination regulator RecX [Acidobacteriota bacterium]|nr:recombination regulator RecX [Acidobacteriota bacterium]